MEVLGEVVLGKEAWGEVVLEKEGLGEVVLDTLRWGEEVLEEARPPYQDLLEPILLGVAEVTVMVAESPRGSWAGRTPTHLLLAYTAAGSSFTQHHIVFTTCINHLTLVFAKYYLVTWW